MYININNLNRNVKFAFMRQNNFPAMGENKIRVYNYTPLQKNIGEYFKYFYSYVFLFN